MNTKNWAIALFSATIAVVAVVSTASAETVEITVNDLSVRSGPGPNYSIITVWNKGFRGNRIKQEGNWAYVVTGRVEGWVYAPYIKVVGADTGTGTGEGIGGGNIGTGPAPSRYQSSGNIDNARYGGNGSASVQIVGTGRVVVTAIEASSARPFSVTYYGEITSRSREQIVANVTAFASTPTGNQTIPKSGNCQIRVSIDSSVLPSFTCQANSGLDHGKANFTGR